MPLRIIPAGQDLKNRLFMNPRLVGTHTKVNIHRGDRIHIQIVPDKFRIDIGQPSADQCQIAEILFQIIKHPEENSFYIRIIDQGSSPFLPDAL